MSKWFKIIMNILAIIYICVGYLHYTIDSFLAFPLIIFGIAVIEITILTHLPKYILKLLHNYILKVIEENQKRL